MRLASATSSAALSNGILPMDRRYSRRESSEGSSASWMDGSSIENPATRCDTRWPFAWLVGGQSLRSPQRRPEGRSRTCLHGARHRDLRRGAALQSSSATSPCRSAAQSRGAWQPLLDDRHLGEAVPAGGVRDLGLVDHRAGLHVGCRAIAVGAVVVARLVLVLRLVRAFVLGFAGVMLAVALRRVGRRGVVAAGPVASRVAGGVVAAAAVVDGRVLLDLRLVLVVA